MCSYSLRRTRRILEPVMKRSHEAMRQWVQRLAPICDGFDVDRNLVRTIFVDETMIKVKDRRMWVWVAFEPRLKVFLAFHLSYNQSILDAHVFLRELRRRYGRKPIWTDEALFYPEACRWSRLEHHVYGQELKNQTGRMNESLKDRLECFDDLLPCLKEDCDREHVHNWIRVFRFYHNYVRVNEEIRRPPIGYGDGPEYRRFIYLLGTRLLT